MSFWRPLEQFGTGRKGNTALILSGVAASLREAAAESKEPLGYFYGRQLSFDFQPNAKTNSLTQCAFQSIGVLRLIWSSAKRTIRFAQD